MSFPLVLEPHCESWSADFATERVRIQGALGSSLRALHHIGSTAIPGIHAKPIIDVLAEVGSLEAVDACRDDMERLGYEVMGEFGIPGRRYFRKTNTAGFRTHHLHAFVTGSPDLVRHLAFRDYLRAHPAIALEYSALKIRLLASCNGDMEAYIDGKTPFIQEMERRALDWFAKRPGYSQTELRVESRSGV